MQRMTKRKAQPVVAPQMSQETKDHLRQVKKDNKARDEPAQMERQAARHTPNRMARVRRVVNKYLANSRRYHAGDSEAIAPWEFPVSFD